jgi:hypothetical protein
MLKRLNLRKRRSEFTTDWISFEVPGNVLANVSTSPTLFFEELNQKLSVTVEAIGNFTQVWHCDVYHGIFISLQIRGNGLL